MTEMEPHRARLDRVIDSVVAARMHVELAHRIAADADADSCLDEALLQLRMALHDLQVLRRVP